MPHACRSWRKAWPSTAVSIAPPCSWKLRRSASHFAKLKSPDMTQSESISGRMMCESARPCQME
eukprot:4176277-Alexandrium_andersonii.AAC.1